jgi:quaternary ammonium compound-resistance protein SugE
MLLLIKAIQDIPIGTAYVVWTGIGAVGTVPGRVVAVSEPADSGVIFFITTLILSIIGLRWFSNS